MQQNGKPEIDFYKEAAYAEFRATLDAELKHLKQAGNGSRKWKVEPLTQEERVGLDEEYPWGQDHSLQAHLNSVFFFNGICFALRSGDEHRRLQYNDSQNTESMLTSSILKILQKTNRGA